MSYVHPEDKEVFPNALQSVLNGEIENAIVNFRLRTQSQGYRWYVCSLMSIKSDGKVKYVTGTRRDITNEMESRIELERSQSRLQILLDKIPSPVYIVDPECNKVVYCNAKTKSVLGFDIGSSSIQIYQEEFGVKVARKNEEILKSGQDYTATETIILNSGEVKNTFVTKTLVIYNNKPHILISRIDISEQEQMGAYLSQANTSLWWMTNSSSRKRPLPPPLKVKGAQKNFLMRSRSTATSQIRS